ncbi:hypothetical protein [Campylobacter corcagiensis]|nr:hypothetical protein [Campylobacter corcagiensis]
MQDECQLEKFNGLDRCALHCKKNRYPADSHSFLLLEFYKKLKEYILDEIFTYPNSNDNTFTRDEIDKFLTNYHTQEDNEHFQKISNYLKTKTIALTDIYFPERNSRDYFDYQKILVLFAGIHFDCCKFYLTTLTLKNTKVFFQDCVFYYDWSIVDYEILENVDNLVYQSCNFKGDVSNNSSEDSIYYIINSNQFDFTCIFEKNIYLNDVEFNGLLFSEKQNNKPEEKIKLSRILLKNCIFNKKVEINNFNIKDFIAINTLFEGKFEFKENIIEKLDINDTNFKKLVDFYGSEFQNFNIYKSIFYDFVGFENCKFGKEHGQKKYIATFKYATFLNIVNFRNTKFYGGLDLENANLKEPPNFLKTYVEYTNTNRETIRIIKHSFDKIGNIIEGNKYFSKEMKKYKDELEGKSWKGNFQEKLVFWVNSLTSDFGQDCMRPICIIIVLSIIHTLLIYGYENNFLYNIYEPWNNYLNSISTFLNSLAKNISPFKGFLKNGMEFLSLIFGIAYSILIWLTVVAVKMHTKRN